MIVKEIEYACKKKKEGHVHGYIPEREIRMRRRKERRDYSYQEWESDEEDEGEKVSSVRF